MNSCSIEARIPAHVSYACRFWVNHLEKSGQKICVNDRVHTFLKQHFLHWFEAMAWLGKTSDVIHHLEKLQYIIDVSYTLAETRRILRLTSNVKVNRKAQLLHFLNDAMRIALRNRALIDQAPLQTYLSALVFTPLQSVVRRIFGNHVGRYLNNLPRVQKRWSADRLRLEGHEGYVIAVAISADGKTVVSSSDDKTVRLWSTVTGEQTMYSRSFTPAPPRVEWS